MPVATAMSPKARIPVHKGAALAVPMPVLAEDHFQAIYDSVSDGIFLIDPETGLIQDLNRRMYEWFGHDRETFLGMDLGRLALGLWPYTSDQAVEWIRKAREVGPQNFEWLCATKGGHLLWLELSMRRAEIGSLERLVITAGDITQRKKVEMERTARLKRAEAQNAVSLTLAGVGLDYQTALTLIVQHLATQLGDLCALELLGEDGLLHPAVVSQSYVGGNPFLPDFKNLEPMPLGALGAGRVAVDGQAIRLEDPVQVQALVRPEFQPYHQQFSIHSLLIVSVRTSAQAIGTLSMVRGGASRPYTLEDQAMLQNLADRAALTITNSKLYAENLKQAEALKAANRDLEQRVEDRTLELAQANARLQLMAMEDGLTRLANRRHFDTVLANEVHRCQRSSEPLALLFCDVDFFKKYNDTYGHAEGDACLRMVGEVMRGLFRRAEDLPARYGGEEFAVILPGCDPVRAREAAERLRKGIEDQAMPHASSTVGPVVTISVGYISSPITEETRPEWFITQADACLYRSKAEGRNRVTGA